MTTSPHSFLLSSRRRSLLRGMLGALLLCLVAAAGNLTGCGGSEPPRVTLLLLDASASTDAANMRERYTSIAQTVTGDLRGGDRVLAERITGASMQEAELPVNATVPSFDPLRSDQIKHEQAMKAVRDTLERGVATLLEGESSQCTDIFGALRLAGKVFQNADSNASKRLVLASDMVETCGPNFRRRSLDSASTAALIEARRQAGRLPDLTGVRVWVAGATATGKLSPERVRGIERFWLRYFEATGADLEPSRYGPTLLGWS